MGYRAQIQVEWAKGIPRYDLPPIQRGLTSQFLPTKHEAEAWLAGAVEFARSIGLPVLVMQVTWDPGERGSSAVAYSSYVMDERAFCSCDNPACGKCGGYCEEREQVRINLLDGNPTRGYCAACSCERGRRIVPL